jgi:hypothetical protein
MRDSGDVLQRIRAIAADQFESKARTGSRHLCEGLDERRHVPPVEHRSDEQHQGIPRGRN